MKTKIVALVTLVIFTFSCSKEEIPINSQEVNFETSIVDTRSVCDNNTFTMRIKWSFPLENDRKIIKRAYYSEFFGRHALMGIHDDGTETWIFNPSFIDQSMLVPGQCRSTIIVDEVRQDPDIEDDSADDSIQER